MGRREYPTTQYKLLAIFRILVESCIGSTDLIHRNTDKKKGGERGERVKLVRASQTEGHPDSVVTTWRIDAITSLYLCRTLGATARVNLLLSY